MKNLRNSVAMLAAFVLLTACGPSETPPPGPASEPPPARGAGDAAEPAADMTELEIAPGLTMRMLRSGSGDVAVVGDTAVVHYTGWLYDETAPDNRGQKFDSSLDRGQHFRFPLGAGRVIKGWDQGVVGMRIGEVRELTIAPEMGYGQRGAGNAIPPGATLVFEVELADVEGRPAGKEGQ